MKFFLLIIFVLCHHCHSNEENYQEELYIRPLATGQTYFNLQFTTIASANFLQNRAIHHYYLFPKVIADVIRSNGVEEFHVALTQGLWRYDRWGMPLVGAPPGAEVWAWFHPDQSKHVSSNWKSFVHQLGGLLCASLNFVDSNVSSTSPHYSFRPQSTLPMANQSYQDSSLLRYAVLPREIVCTENLTPWKKFLPCSAATTSNHQGLIALLDNAPKLHHSSYHSLRMDLRKICSNRECTSVQLEFSMSLAIVVDGTISKSGDHEWSLRSIFGSNIPQACPLSSLTNVYLDLQVSKIRSLNISPEPDFTIEHGTNPIVVYDLNNENRQRNSFSLSCTSKKLEKSDKAHALPIVVHRYPTGSGGRTGGIKTVIHVNDQADEITLLYMEQIPWYFRLFLHTLKITNLDDPRIEIQPVRISYQPGHDRERPYQLELILKTRQSLMITMEYEMAFLKWDEFPPDPNHGFYIPSAIISTQFSPRYKSNYVLRTLPSFSLNQSLSQSSSDGFVRIYSESLLVNLPTPDFSMPFNVICLGCTAVALAFGGLHNLTTKQFHYGEKQKKNTFRQRFDDLRIRFIASRNALTARVFGKRREHQE